MKNGVNGQINWPQLPSKLNEDEIEQINDMEWAEQDPEIKLKYPDEFVAVHRRHVIPGETRNRRDNHSRSEPLAIMRLG